MGLPLVRVPVVTLEGYSSGIHTCLLEPSCGRLAPGLGFPTVFGGWVWALDSTFILISWKVFGLPPSVLCCASQEPAGTEEAYKVAVDSFLQQRHMLGVEGCVSPAEGEEQMHPSHSQEPLGTTGSPIAAQTEALSGLFNSIKTLTAKEELLQTLR